MLYNVDWLLVSFISEHKLRHCEALQQKHRFSFHEEIIAENAHPFPWTFHLKIELVASLNGLYTLRCEMFHICWPQLKRVDFGFDFHLI